jgi:molecular chaperone HscB
VINKAYHTLKNPLDRAHYILGENGIKIGEDESLSDPELLMEVMEFREELDEVTSEKELLPLKERNDGKRSKQH